MSWADPNGDQSLSTIAAERVFKALNGDGRSVGHRQREAIFSLLRRLEDGLAGKPFDGFSLASLDPGMGKSLTIKTFLDVWRELGFRPEGSVLVGLSRLAEIESFIKDSGLSPDDYGVFTANETLNALGNQRRHEARVLFTTQQMIVSRTREGSFAQASEFHYRGKPRSLRVWDETFVPAAHITLGRHRLSSLLDPLEQVAPSFVEALSKFIHQLHDVRAGKLVVVPSALSQLAAEASSFGSRGWRVLTERQRNIMAELAGASDQPMLVHRDNNKRLSLAGASRRLPADLAPAVILDASGRARGTYELWETHRGGLSRLPAATADYCRLKVHLWRRASGKTELRDDGSRAEILRAVADLLNTAPDEPWLVIHHRAENLFNIEGELRGLLGIGDDDRRISFLHWGNHHGTNDYRYIRNVAVVGLWEQPEAAYVALGMAASGLSRIDDAERRELKFAEHRHNLLQAICRASVRQASDGMCGPCTVYVIANPKIDAARLLQETFPGCPVEDWRPMGWRLKGKAQAIAGELARRFADPSVTRVAKKDVKLATGIGDDNFTRPLKTSAMIKWLSEQTIRVRAHCFERDRHNPLVASKTRGEECASDD